MGSRSPATALSFTACCTMAALLASCSSPPPTPRWQNTGGPRAQDITALLAEGPDGAVLTAGLAGGAIFRSTDQGRTWKKLGTLPVRTPVHVLQREPGGTALYAGTGRGLMVSSGDGVSWSAVSADERMAKAEVHAVGIDPLDPRYILAGVRNAGIFRTTDGGTTWARVAGDDTTLAGTVHDLKISPSNPNLVYASLSRRGVFVSTDRGATWSPRTAQLAHSGTVARALVLHSRSSDLLCFGTEAGDIYRSTDGGGHWRLTRQGLHSVPLTSLASPADSPGTLLTSAEDGLFRSTDFGATWERILSDLPRIPATLVTGGRVLYAFAQGIGLQRSEDGGGSWHSADRDLGGSTPHLIRAGARSGDVYCAVGSALFVYRPRAAAWVQASDGIYGGTVASLAFDFDSDSTLYAATDQGLFRSTTSGAAWEPMPRTFTPAPIRFFDTHRFIRTRLFLAQDEGVLVSTDRGASWKPARPFGERARVRTLTYAPTNSGFIHAATANRAVIGSVDGGITWESRRYGIRDSSISAVARDRDNPRLLYCWNENGEGYRSTDMGAEWTAWAPPWKNNTRVHVWVDREEPHLVVALVEGTTYLSGTAGASWRALPIEDLKAEVTALFWNRREGMLYAGTQDQGVFRVPLSQGDGSP